MARGFFFFLFFLGRVGPEVTSTIHARRESRAVIFFGWVGPKVTSRVRQYVARHYGALTLYAVRGYVALTQDTDLRQFVILTAVRGGRFAGRGARLVIFNSY